MEQKYFKGYDLDLFIKTLIYVQKLEIKCCRPENDGTITVIETFSGVQVDLVPTI